MDTASLGERAAPVHESPRYAFRAPHPRSPSGAIYTYDHRLYLREPLPQDLPRLLQTGQVLRYLIVHDRRLCAPFGMFCVYRFTKPNRVQLIGRQLTYPSGDECARLNRHATERAARHDPTLPEELTYVAR